MSIKVHLYSNLQHLTNDQNMVEVDGSTVGQCLIHLAKQFPRIRKELFDKHGTLFRHIFISINLESPYPEELAKPVKDGDELYIVLMSGGG